MIDMNLMVPMRDGLKLRTDVYRPTCQPQGTLLLGTPYNSKTPWLMCLARKMAKRGFVVVVQDNRGRFGSEGQFHPFKDERTDGLDTLGWIAQQPWNNGKVGLFGACYSAYASYPMMAEAPPAGLQVLAAVWCMELIDLHDLVYPGGALRLHWALPWLELMRSTGQIDIASPAEDASFPWKDVVSTLPVSSADAKLGGKLATWKTWIQHPVYDAEWKSRSIDAGFAGTTVPTLHISGWFDPCLSQTISSFNQLQARLANQALIVGPWDHATLVQSLVSSALASPGVRDPADKAGDYSLFNRTMEWFERWFSESPPDFNSRPVEFFLDGENHWYGERDWPPSSIEWCKLYLAANGKLKIDHPGEGAQSYNFDPQNPVPTLGGDVFPLGGMTPGPLDQSPIEDRPDCLVFTTDALTRDLAVVGPVIAVLYVSSSAPDTDFTVKMTETLPDGRSEIVCDGILRMRYRESHSRARLITPGKVYRIKVPLGNVARKFESGHRLKVVVSSSNFPKFDRNLNMAQDPETGTNCASAEQRVFFGGLHASFLHLPIMENRGPAMGKGQPLTGQVGNLRAMRPIWR